MTAPPTTLESPEPLAGQSLGAAPCSAVFQKFVQAGDDQQDDADAPQYLEIESLDSGAGCFVRLATERWVVETDAEIEVLAGRLKAALRVNVLPTNDDPHNDKTEPQAPQ